MPTPIKFLSIGAGALVITILCFLFMHLLITTDLNQAPEFDPPAIAAPLLPVIRHENTREVRTRASRIVPADMPPDPEGISIAPQDLVVLVKAPRPNFGSIAEIIDREAINFEMYPPLRDLVPLYVVQPVYPFKAAVREIEGFVVVNFSVRENGTVRNPIVIDSEPRSLFDEAALSAVSKFRFQPRIVGGDAIAVADVQIRFLFRLETAGGTSVTGQLVDNETSGLN